MNNILIVAPHGDDDILGCGGILGKYPESRAAVLSGAFPDQEFDTVPIKKINDFIFKLINMYKPDTVYIPHKDVNQDHVVTHNACLVATRPKPDSCVKRVLAYETLSSTEWTFDGSFKPNVYVKIDIEKKLTLMKDWYKKELKEYPHPRSLKAIRALAMLRGSQVGLEYAEAFMLIREIDGSRT